MSRAKLVVVQYSASANEPVRLALREHKHVKLQPAAAAAPPSLPAPDHHHHYSKHTVAAAAAAGAASSSGVLPAAAVVVDFVVGTGAGVVYVSEHDLAQLNGRTLDDDDVDHHRDDAAVAASADDADGGGGSGGMDHAAVAVNHLRQRLHSVRRYARRLVLVARTSTYGNDQLKLQLYCALHDLPVLAVADPTTAARYISRLHMPLQAVATPALAPEPQAVRAAHTMPRAGGASAAHTDVHLLKTVQSVPGVSHNGGSATKLLSAFGSVLAVANASAHALDHVLDMRLPDVQAAAPGTVAAAAATAAVTGAGRGGAGACGGKAASARVKTSAKATAIANFFRPPAPAAAAAAAAAAGGGGGAAAAAALAAAGSESQLLDDT